MTTSNSLDSVIELFLDAAYSNDISAIKALLDRGIPVDVADDDYTTALQIAAGIGSFEVSQLLLDHGADIDKCNDVGFTPLLIACRNGHLTVVQLLLKSGADSRRCTFYGTNAVTLATAGGHRNVVTYLQGMCDMPQRSAPSPLIAAVAGRHFDLVAFFKMLKNGALWNVQSGLYGTDVYQVVEKYRDKEMKEFLFCLDNYLNDIHCIIRERRKEGRDLLPDIRCLIHDRKINQVQCLLESGREYVQLPVGVTPIMFAAVVGDLDMVKMLVRRCGDIDASVDGFSAITIAMVCGNDSVVKYLCEVERNLNNICGTIRKKDKVPEGRFHARSLESIPFGMEVKKTGNNFFKKCTKLFQRRKTKNMSTNFGNNKYGNRLAFRKRVGNTIGHTAVRIPNTVYDALQCPHDTAHNGYLASRTAIFEKEEIILKKLSAYGVRKLGDLFKKADEDYLRFYGAECLLSLNLPKSVSLESSIFPHVAEAEANEIYFTPSSHLSRNVSDLRRDMFQFKFPRNHHITLAAASDFAKFSAQEAGFWAILTCVCGNGICNILRNEGVDFESFLLLSREDFEGMLLDEDRINTLERMQEYFNKGRVVYL